MGQPIHTPHTTTCITRSSVLVCVRWARVLVLGPPCVLLGRHEPMHTRPRSTRAVHIGPPCVLLGRHMGHTRAPARARTCVCVRSSARVCVQLKVAGSAAKIRTPARSAQVGVFGTSSVERAGTYVGAPFVLTRRHTECVRERVVWGRAGR